MMPQLLAASEALSTKHIHRYFCDLASTQLDYNGVPEIFRVVGIVLAEPTKSAIEDVISVISSCDWLQSYSLVSYWQPLYCCF